MATLANESRVASSKVGVPRFALTGGLAATTFFVLCWLGAVLGIGPAIHMYIQLFTDAATTSGVALLLGACLSLVFGLVAGGLIAFFYNLLAPLDGR